MNTSLLLAMFALSAFAQEPVTGAGSITGLSSFESIIHPDPPSCGKGCYIVEYQVMEDDPNMTYAMVCFPYPCENQHPKRAVRKTITVADTSITTLGSVMGSNVV